MTTGQEDGLHRSAAGRIRRRSEQPFQAAGPPLTRGNDRGDPRRRRGTLLATRSQQGDHSRNRREGRRDPPAGSPVRGVEADILDAVIRRGAPQRQDDGRASGPSGGHTASYRRRRRAGESTRGRCSAPPWTASTTPRSRIGWTPGGCSSRLANESVEEGAPRPPAPGTMDPRIVMAAMVALAYGWVGAQDWLVGSSSWRRRTQRNRSGRSGVSACTSPTWSSLPPGASTPTRGSCALAARRRHPRTGRCGCRFC